MPIFGKMFIQFKGKPILYKGKTLVMAYKFFVQSGSKYKIVLESTKSEWRQGVKLGIRSGALRINSNESDKGFVIWEDTAPMESEFIFEKKKSDKDNFYILVSNTWDCGDGVVESWHGGAAMIVEKIQNGKRYRCNDGSPDEDFDDIIFRIKKLN